jgi:hypothetical protein
VREEVAAVRRAGTGGGEGGDEDAESQRAAELVCDVDQPGAGAGEFVLRPCGHWGFLAVFE